MPTEQGKGVWKMKYIFGFFFLMCLGHGQASAEKPVPVQPVVVAVAIVPSPVRVPVPSLGEEEDLTVQPSVVSFSPPKAVFSVRRLARLRLPAALASWFWVQNRRH